MMSSRLPAKRRAAAVAAAIVVAIGALALFWSLSVGRHPAPAPPPEPFGPIRSIRQIQGDAPALTGRFVRIHGRITTVRDLNPGLRFPWDVVYTVDDGSSTIPVHWFAQEQRRQQLSPPKLPDRTIFITGKVKRNVELDGKTYPLIIHEQTELHNQENPALPVASTLH